MALSQVLEQVAESLKAMPPEELQELAMRMREDTALFAEICMPHIITENLTIEQKEAFLRGELDRDIYMPEFHRKIYRGYDLLFKGIKLHMGIVVFRGAAKTTTKVIATVKALCFALEPFIVLISETVEQAMIDLESVKDEIENNPVINLLFGNLKGDKWNVKHSTFMNGGYKLHVRATGLNGRIRGIKEGNQRPTMVISDDFESEGNSLTVEGREKVNRAITSKIMRMGDYIYKLVFQGTIIHNDAYLAKLEENERFRGSKGLIIREGISRTESIFYDKLTKSYRSAPVSLFKIGTPTWPARYPLKYIEEEFNYAKSYNGGADFWQFVQELYNVPRHSVDNEFDIEKLVEIEGQLKRYGNLNYLQVKDKKIHVYVYEGFDPAAGREDNNDFSVYAKIAVTPEGKIVICRIKEMKIDIDEQTRFLLDTNRDTRAKAVGLEAYGYQVTLKNLIEKEAQKRNQRINLVKYSDSRSGGKNKLKSSLSPMMNRGEIGYLKDCEGIDTLKIQMANFDKKSVHDDTIDALYLAIWVSADMKPAPIDIDKRIVEMKQNAIPGMAEMKKQKRKRSIMSY